MNTQQALPNLTRITPKPIIEHCPRPGCTFAASALSMGRVDRALAAHIVKAHMEASRDDRH